MPSSINAICSDFYVNQKLALKMDLPTRRETVLDMFDRIRREMPVMDRFRRYEGEVALESPDEHAQYCWLAMRDTSIRSGWVNPEELSRAYRLHQLILEVAPYFLSISPIDVDYLELIYGFDIGAETNRNEVVFDALLGDSPLQQLVAADGESIVDSQPFIGFSLNDRNDLQAFVEVKTRTGQREIAQSRYQDEPISVYVTVRKHGPLKTIKELGTTFGLLAGHLERIAEERVIPNVIVPIRNTLLSRLD
ncbi:MAG: hypothetical protein ACYTF9_12090 [Planctomycetota bacterium]|jgi:hypothetical protein